MFTFLYCRPIGAEIEINAFDGVMMTPREKLPSGIEYVANLIAETLGEYVEIRDWGHTHWYKTYGYWVLKPDNSCGMEVCSPVVQGWYGLKKICQVIDVFQNHQLISADSNCSYHLHIDINDLMEEEIGNVLRWWIKCEPVFFDSVPDIRKNNRYCQFIGLWDWLDDTLPISTTQLIEALGVGKYTSVNTYHLWAGERNTIEFRIGEHTLCKNSFFAKNWTRLLIHFLETAKQKTPDNLTWLDVKEVFEFLNFLRDDLSPGMLQIRNWFLGRLHYNTISCLDGLFKEGRMVTKKQISELLDAIPDFDLKQSLYPTSYKDAVYNKIYST
jgi:hypothetical protein